MIEIFIVLGGCPIFSVQIYRCPNIWKFQIALKSIAMCACCNSFICLNVQITKYSELPNPFQMSKPVIFLSKFG
jgi:hypothetical protein